MKRRLTDLPAASLGGKRVLVRVDYNVPLQDGEVRDDARIRASLPTLEYLLAHGARPILLSHLGRPKGQRREELTLAPVAERLARLLPSVRVTFVPEVVGAAARAAVERIDEGEVVLLENVRFLPGEETDDAALGGTLASLADVYVNDAFGTAHRAHASTHAAALAARSDSKPAVAGLLVDRELRFLGDALHDPERPFVAILGGAKISGKIDVIEALLPRVDRLIVGGAMANTFFRALGLEIGGSLVEDDRIDMASQLLDRAGSRLVLPVDCAIETGPGAPDDATPERTEVARDDVPRQASIFDVGARSIDLFREHLAEARTILWNGPMGMFETPAFAWGTIALAGLVAGATKRGATTIAGGGDTAAALELAGFAEQVTHVSTGGGAALEFLEGRELPGVAVLDDRPD